MTEIKAVFSGFDEARAELKKIDRDGRAATKSAVRAVQNLGKSRVRSRLRGQPRWGHRGASSRTGPEVNLGFTFNPRSGGPGRFTGQLSSGVSGMKQPRSAGDGAFRGAVWVGKGGVRNLYKWRLEQEYPYFEPAIKGMEPKVAQVWEKAWKRVIDRRS